MTTIHLSSNDLFFLFYNLSFLSLLLLPIRFYSLLKAIQWHMGAIYNITGTWMDSHTKSPNTYIRVWNNLKQFLGKDCSCCMLPYPYHFVLISLRWCSSPRFLCLTFRFVHIHQMQNYITVDLIFFYFPAFVSQLCIEPYISRRMWSIHFVSSYNNSHSLCTLGVS